MKRIGLRLLAMVLAVLMVMPAAAMAVVSKVKLTRDAFDVELPVGAVYDGTPKEAVVFVRNDYTGSVILKYNGSEVPPVNAGTYTVTIDCGGDDKYDALSDLEVGGFTIEKAEMLVDPLVIEVCEGDTYQDYELPAGWALGENPTVLEFWGVGKDYVYTACHTPEDTVNYKTMQNYVIYRVTKAAPITPTPVPTATPAPTAVPETPATGDDVNLSLLLSAAVLSGAAMLILRRRVKG